jgi:cytochrome P450
MSQPLGTFPIDREARFLPPAPLREAVAVARPRRLRFPDGHVGWLVGDYANARSILADRRFVIGVIRQPSGQPGKVEAYVEALGALRAGAIMSIDPPVHTRLRRAIGGRFTPSGVQAFSERIERIVQSQLDELERRGPVVDLFAAFALLIPSQVICDLLGVPASDQHRFIEPTELLLSPQATPDQVRTAFAEFSQYVRAVVAHKRAQPGDDLLSDLVAAPTLSED